MSMSTRALPPSRHIHMAPRRLSPGSVTGAGAHSQSLHRFQYSRSSATIVRATTLPDVPAKLQAMDDDTRKKWDEATAWLIQDEFAGDEEEASKLLVKAYGWGLQGYWRQSKVDEVPDASRMQETVQYLTEDVNMAAADVPALVKKFPEVLGLSQEIMQDNVSVLVKEWKMNADRVAATIKRKPQVLGNTLDCYGDCAGECNRCWVRF
mmetsp:Transcript_14135/g.35443  ORF Transcript_14135/g.35443 Transcript_14135/m.35443 type:complete len:208 (+) Transcript_14135:91-714(+)